MKRSITVTVVALALACASGVATAQNHPDDATMQQRVTVTATPGNYETYEIALDTGYSLQARVGNTHRQYMQAWRSAAQLETLRKQGMAQGPFVTVAIDNSTGPGHAWQFRLTDRRSNTLAVVNVYCKHAAAAGGRCQLVSLPVAGRSSLAALGAERVPLAQVQAEPGR
jgi:hypothetical protein